MCIKTRIEIEKKEKGKGTKDTHANCKIRKVILQDFSNRNAYYQVGSGRVGYDDPMNAMEAQDKKSCSQAASPTSHASKKSIKIKSDFQGHNISKIMSIRPRYLLTTGRGP